VGSCDNSVVVAVVEWAVEGGSEVLCVDTFTDCLFC
jgi:hypothetical protein